MEKKGKWQVTSNSINGRTMYIAYRLRDASGVDHSGNREYCGAYVEDCETAEQLWRAAPHREYVVQFRPKNPKAEREAVCVYQRLPLMNGEATP